MKVHALVLAGFGINCEAETKTAFEGAGAQAACVHLNDLIADPGSLSGYQILAIPGGFSFGDDVASGRILANRLRFKLGAAFERFVKEGKLAIGICNGFQVMVKMGFLPLSKGAFTQEVTLTHNDSDRFENRWVNLRTEPSTRCVWLRGIECMELPVRHGEGRFVARDDSVMKTLVDNGQIAFRYALRDGSPARGRFPENPNGSVGDVAGICDPTGRIFGLMPHPEAFLDGTNHPRWNREGHAGVGAGLGIFRNAVAFAQANLG